MRVIVICADPDQASEAGSVATVLTDLGCRVTLGRFALGGLDLDAIAERPSTVIVVEAGGVIARAHHTRKRARASGAHAATPSPCDAPAREGGDGPGGFERNPARGAHTAGQGGTGAHRANPSPGP